MTTVLRRLQREFRKGGPKASAWAALQTIRLCADKAMPRWLHKHLEQLLEMQLSPKIRRDLEIRRAIRARIAGFKAIKSFPYFPPRSSVQQWMREWPYAKRGIPWDELAEEYGMKKTALQDLFYGKRDPLAERKAYPTRKT